MTNSLVKLHSEGQSYWLDFIERNLLTSGKLKKMVEEDGLRGMTSNPTIFQKAISSSHEYDAALKKAAMQGQSTPDIFETLAIQDIQKAADIYRPVYTSSGGTDGFVSLEVNPTLAHDTQETLNEAKKLFGKVKRPNVMIKIPGTKEGLPAIEESIFNGININITLLFSVENYKEVVEAYLRGLERRAKKKLPINKIASVASFFVSRVDTAVDKILDQMILSGASGKERAEILLHKAAIANAKVAYEYYLDIIQSSRFLALKAKGAQPQRLLWASTGTKDKRLSDVVYIEELIGPDTVNTMPPQTADAFKNHGIVEQTLQTGLEQAHQDLIALTDLGINLEEVTAKLQEEGVKLFTKSFEDLMQVVGAKRELLVGHHEKKLKLGLTLHKDDFAQAFQKIEKENWVPRIWSKEASLWKQDPEHQKIIKNSLGWLTVASTIQNNLKRIEAIVKDVRKAGFTHALLLGMGGSSLAPEVLRLTFGKKAGYPDFTILDSTEPSSVLEKAKWSKPKKTLYIVASKSGSTTEPNAFLAYFYDLVKKEKGAKAGENFTAITDPGTHMETVAKEKKFRHIILNPPDIGGRYSALSFFGMLPAALMGIDVASFIQRAQQMADACSPYFPVSQNPGVLLGAALGVLAAKGRNKATFFLSKDIESFSTWLEQLIAESTGKEGLGIVPVVSEEIQDVAFYGNDRVFISLSTSKFKDKGFFKRLDRLERGGHPVIRISLDKKEDLAQEFFKWEMATAVAGGVLGIDPFDQPNVQESKDLTKQFIETYRSQGKLPEATPILVEDWASVYSINGTPFGSSLSEILGHLLGGVKDGDYVAILAYLKRDKKNETLLQEIRNSILKSKKVATTLGFGPRFLHSTGQLHKGGDDHGVFIQITATDKQDLPIPGEAFSFAVLKEAQALGDLAALKNKHRRAIRIHLHDPEKGLTKLKESLSQAHLN